MWTVLLSGFVASSPILPASLAHQGCRLKGSPSLEQGRRQVPGLLDLSSEPTLGGEFGSSRREQQTSLELPQRRARQARAPRPRAAALSLVRATERKEKQDREAVMNCDPLDPALFYV
ncbi:hypothetical protein AC579_10629 [Pseudocercospora musae]|uniref:Uncharacterized protein n=1 Tax=Pseudocercospora musae TaxID=113226 RepID=A0A139HKS7_9PEZI|nr:hypothetical protein AC579_10629 [Pseudocercospora musae]